MRKDFVNEVARVQRVKRTDLIEKDLLLKDIDEKEFYKFLEKPKMFLKEVIDKLT